MTMTELFLAELEREAIGTRAALERVPDGKNDWKPHEKSMKLGDLATMVATMPSWAEMMINQDELDLKPRNGDSYRPPDLHTSRERVEAHEDCLKKVREALKKTTDEHLMRPWRLLVGGQVVLEQPRHVVLRDSFFNHLAHHRGQLTVYLRLTNASVPAIYGPSADEGKMGQ